MLAQLDALVSKDLVARPRLQAIGKVLEGRLEQEEHQHPRRKKAAGKRRRLARHEEAQRHDGKHQRSGGAQRPQKRKDIGDPHAPCVGSRKGKDTMDEA